jgi:hypothetical protein
MPTVLLCLRSHNNSFRMQSCAKWSFDDTTHGVSWRNPATTSNLLNVPYLHGKESFEPKFCDYFALLRTVNRVSMFVTKCVQWSGHELQNYTKRLTIWSDLEPVFCQIVRHYPVLLWMVQTAAHLLNLAVHPLRVSCRVRLWVYLCLNCRS